MSRLSGVRIGASPGENEYTERSTQSLKPPVGVMVRVELFEGPPASIVRNDRLAVSAKLGPETITMMLEYFAKTVLA